MITFCVIALLSSSVRAQKSPIFAPDDKAIKGYDVVAFFTMHHPVKGVDSLAYDWQGVHWLFSTRSNLQAFQTNPAQFAPQYGGYCAYGASQGHKAPIDVETWTIVGNKLYFNYDSDVKEKWVKNEPAYIQDANQKWPDIKDKN
jgi:YHS domain-containing protein